MSKLFRAVETVFVSPRIRRVVKVSMVVLIGLACVSYLIAPVFGQDAPQVVVAGQEKKVSFLTWLIHVSGIIGAFILLLSLYFMALVIRCFIELKLSIAAPPELVAVNEKLLSENNVKEVLQGLQGEDSFYGQTLLAGVSNLKYGLEVAREKLERKAESLTAQMERGISNLAVIGTLGPMIGLLGTLKGMIASFSVIAMSGTALDASEVAEGISEALVLTFEGVMLSVPAIYFFSLFRNRIAQIDIEASSHAEEHLRQIAMQMKPREARVAGV